VSEHLSEKAIKRYRSRQLSPAELLALDDHLAECDSCKAEARNIENSAAVFAQTTSALELESALEESHLEYQQLADYVDNTADDLDRELIETHLGFCQSCRKEMNDLQAIKPILDQPAPDYFGKTVGSSQRFSNWWPLPLVRRPVQVAAVILIGAFVVWLVVPYFRRPPQDAQNQPGQAGNRDVAVANNTPGSETASPTPQQDQHNDFSLVADLIDGDRHITLTSDGKLSGLESTSSEVQAEVAAALRDGRVRAPSVADLRGRAGELMGEAGSREYGLLSPVATVVESRTPTFRWHAIEGADNYVVSIFGPDSSKVAESAQIREPTWRVNVPLPRGRIYSWQVRATKQGKEVLMPPPAAPVARFRVIEGAKAERLAQIRHGQVSSHLVLGLAYADAGLLEEAEPEFKKLVAANPKSSVARSLLLSVQFKKNR
jgi:hypothetical protein